LTAGAPRTGPIRSRPIRRRPRVIVETLKGIARRLGTAQRKAAPLEIEALASCAAHHRRDLLGIRDRAIVALGFFFAARRSELAAVRVEDIEFTGEGLRLTIPRSKTDQLAAGATIGIPRASDPSVCPIERLHAWLDAGRIRRGAVFRRIDRWVWATLDRCPSIEPTLDPTLERILRRLALEQQAVSPDGIAPVSTYVQAQRDHHASNRPLEPWEMEPADRRA
jgi:integrase